MKFGTEVWNLIRKNHFVGGQYPIRVSSILPQIGTHIMHLFQWETWKCWNSSMALSVEWTDYFLRILKWKVTNNAQCVYVCVWSQWMAVGQYGRHGHNAVLIVNDTDDEDVTIQHHPTQDITAAVLMLILTSVPNNSIHIAPSPQTVCVYHTHTHLYFTISGSKIFKQRQKKHKHR